MTDFRPVPLDPGRNRALSNLLSTFSLASKRRLLAQHQLPFEGAYYAAIRIGVFDLPGRGTDLPDEQLLETRGWIQGATEAALQPLCTAYFVAPEFYAQALFLALPVGARLEQLLPAIQSAMVRTFRALAARRQIGCYCAMSQPVRSLEALPLAYRQASDLVISRRNTCTPACYLAGQETTPGQERVFLEVLQQLGSLLAAHQFGEIPDYLRQQYLNHGIALADIRDLHALLANYTAKALGAQQGYDEALRLLSRLDRHFYIQFQLEDWHADLQALAALLERAQRAAPPGSMGSAGARITAWLVEHQYDPELNLNLLAGVFHLSASYISRAFKDYTGLTMMEFLTNLRLNRAKELLRTTSWSVGDIARAVGYTPDTLSRVFRRREGQSPSEYRAAHPPGP